MNERSFIITDDPIFDPAVGNHSFNCLPLLAGIHGGPVIYGKLKRACRAAAIALLMSAVGLPGLAADAPYPNKPIRLLNGFTVGGGTDTLARILAQAMTESLGQSVVVDSKPGANGLIATLELAKSPPDGYTIMGAISSFVTNPLLKKQRDYDPVKDFTPIAIVASVPYVLVASPSLQVKNVEELLAAAKADPGKLSYGSSGTGSPQHLFAEMMKNMAGVDVLEVPYKGGSQLMPDLLSGRLSMSWFSTVIAMPYLKDGRLRALAVSTRDRIESLPSVPTLSEAGVPGFHADQFTAIIGPAGMPKPVVDKLQGEIIRLMKTPELQAKFREQGAEPRFGTATELTALLKNELSIWERVIRENKIPLQ
jgi:tripartite-type tricarboxylate transporter receptor subunit TctC